MKIEGHVIEVTDFGGLMRVSIQAPVGPSAADEIRTHVVYLKDTRANRRAFHLGRRVSMTLTPEKE